MRRLGAARGHRGRDLTHFFKQSLQTRTPSLPRCSPLRSSPFASSAPHPQLKVGNNANQSTLRRLRVSDTPSHFPFRERKMHVDSRLRSLSGVSGNSGGALTSFLCRISWSPQIPNTSLSLSLCVCRCLLLRVGARKIILPLCCLLGSARRRSSKGNGVGGGNQHPCDIKQTP